MNTTHSALTPSVRELRHRAEIPMLSLCVGVTLLGVVIVVVASVTGNEPPAWASIALAGLAAPVLLGTVYIRLHFWKTIANGVEITPQQLPEIHSMYVELAHNMGIGEVPRLYLVNGNGALNAFASKCQVRRTYVVIYSDLLDVAYEFDDFETVKFVLAHELGHIKCGHVNLWRSAVRVVPTTLFLGQSMSRAQEYSADRVASYFAPAGANGLMVLFAGKRMYRRTNFVAYKASMNTHKNGFWLRFVNFLADHAVGFRRMETLSRVESEGWNVHGKML